MLGISVARQQEVLAQFTSLTKQRKDVLPNPDRLDSLTDSRAHLELIATAKNRSNPEKVLPFPVTYTEDTGPRKSHQNGYG